nr:unnamed protein product [Spirometra erinaceieuropaei]
MYLYVSNILLLIACRGTEYPEEQLQANQIASPFDSTNGAAFLDVPTASKGYFPNANTFASTSLSRKRACPSSLPQQQRIHKPETEALKSLPDVTFAQDWYNDHLAGRAEGTDAGLPTCPFSLPLRPDSCIHFAGSQNTLISTLPTTGPFNRNTNFTYDLLSKPGEVHAFNETSHYPSDLFILPTPLAATPPISLRSTGSPTSSSSASPSVAGSPSQQMLANSDPSMAFTEVWGLSGREQQNMGHPDWPVEARYETAPANGMSQFQVVTT